MNTDRRRAVAALTAAGLLWGTTVPLSKLALGWLPPGWLTLVRFGLAAAILLVRGPPAAAGRLHPARAGLGRGRVRRVGRGAERLHRPDQRQPRGPADWRHAGSGRGHRGAVAPMPWRARWPGRASRCRWPASVWSPAAGAGGATVGGDGLVLASLLLSAAFTVAQARLLRGRDPVAVTAVQFLGAALAVLPFSVAAEGVPAAPGVLARSWPPPGWRPAARCCPSRCSPTRRAGWPPRWPGPSSTSSRWSAPWQASSSSATRSARRSSPAARPSSPASP